MDANNLVGNLALSVVGGAFVLLFTIQLVLWTRIEKLISMVSDNGSRFDVLDRVGSQITDEEFNSRAVAAGQQRPPSAHKLRRLLERAV